MPRQALEVRGEAFKVLDFIRANETLLGFRQGFFEFKVLIPHERVEIIAFTGLARQIFSRFLALLCNLIQAHHFLSHCCFLSL